MVSAGVRGFWANQSLMILKDLLPVETVEKMAFLRLCTIQVAIMPGPQLVTRYASAPSSSLSISRAHHDSPFYVSYFMC